MSDRPLSADLHEHWNDVFSWVTIHGKVVAGWEQRAAALEAKVERLERLIESWEFEGFAGSSELANEVRAALEGREP